MTQPPRYTHCINAAEIQNACHSVPESMRVNMRQAVFPRKIGAPPCYTVGVQRITYFFTLFPEKQVFITHVLHIWV